MHSADAARGCVSIAISIAATSRCLTIRITPLFYEASARSVMASARILVVVASVWASVWASLWAQSAAAPAPACQEWHECQRLALEAYERREYELFHDLAWRTIQTGPARNADVMLMLARAQSLSGRPHDALVMLGRLAQMGIVTSAARDDDFRAVRQLGQ